MIPVKSPIVMLLWKAVLIPAFAVGFSPRPHYTHSTLLICKGSSLSQEEADRIDQLSSFFDEHQSVSISCLRGDIEGPGEATASTSTITSSRFGGRYAWPNQEEELPLPDPACCLAQINLGEIPTDYIQYCNQKLSAAIPEKGLLQIFLKADQYFGGLDDPQQGQAFRVVFHNESTLANQEFVLQPPVNDYDDLETDLNLFDLEEINPDFLPFSQFRMYDSPGNSIDRLTTTGIPMKFRLDKKAPPTAWDYRSGQITGIGNDYDWYHKSSEEYKDQVEQVCDEKEVYRRDAPCWLFGHSYFTQDDPRGYLRMKGKLKNHEALISFASYDPQVYMWGDMGTARIFLPTQDIQKFRDFSRAYYSWDCS